MIIQLRTISFAMNIVSLWRRSFSNLHYFQISYWIGALRSLLCDVFPQHISERVGGGLVRRLDRVSHRQCLPRFGLSHDQHSPSIYIPLLSALQKEIRRKFICSFEFSCPSKIALGTITIIHDIWPKYIHCRTFWDAWRIF